jgi:hypothetical protein
MAVRPVKSSTTGADNKIKVGNIERGKVNVVYDYRTGGANSGLR